MRELVLSDKTLGLFCKMFDGGAIAGEGEVGGCLTWPATGAAPVPARTGNA
jgi:hypothetical protein